MRRAALLLVLATTAAAGCAGSATTTTVTAAPTATDAVATTPSPTTVPTTATSTTAPVPTTTTASTTAAPATTAAPTPRPRHGLLIANEDGVVRYGEDGSLAELVTGPVVFAVDDTRGGVFFQVRRGRFGPGEGSSTVWWVRAGSAVPEAYLVPSRPDHVLSLHDAVARDGSVIILYTRGEGASIEDMADTLRTYDTTTRTVTVLGGVGGWEAGSEPVSIGGDTIAMTWYAEILNGFEFWDLAGHEIPFPADPFGGDFCEDRQCQWAAELAPDGETFAYFQQVPDAGGFLVNTDLVVVATATGEEVARVGVREEEDAWLPQSIDLAGTTAVVNREAPSRDGYLEPWVVDFGGPEPTIVEVPVAGTARLARAAVEIDAPVVAPRG
jgi:hypothetical protein